MSDPAGDPTMRARPSSTGAYSPAAKTALVVGAGAVAGLAYASVALAFLSLFPVQLSYGRFGRRAGILAAAAAVLVAALTQLLRSAAGGGSGLAGIGTAVATPLALYCALALVNARFWEKVPGTYRILSVSVLCALAALPSVVALVRDGSFEAYFAAQLGQALEPLFAQAGDGGFDSAALAAALDTKALAASTVRIFVSGYAAAITLLVGGSVWAGNRLSGAGSPGHEASAPLRGYRTPYPLLWVFLGSWAALFAALVLKIPEALRAAAWNAAILASLPYAAQGAGIALSLFTRWKLPRFTRLALSAAALLALLTPPASVVIALGLPLLGVTEVWIPYRKLKGAGA